MKNILYILASVLFLYACDGRDAYIESLDTPPNISFEKGEMAISDSIKLSLKNSEKRFSRVINISDVEKNLKEVTYAIVKGSGKIYIDDVLQTNPTFTVKNPSFKFDYEPSAVGYSRISFTATDNFNKSATVMLELFGFVNMLPVVKFSKEDVKRLGVLDMLEYEIDASRSYDSDVNHGGGIENYKYKINDKETILPLSKMKIIFPKAGTYNIEVSVQDNDGEWSQISSQQVNIN